MTWKETANQEYFLFLFLLRFMRQWCERSNNYIYVFIFVESRCAPILFFKESHLHNSSILHGNTAIYTH